MSDVIVGRLMAFEKDGNDGDAVADLDVMVQLCEFKTDGTVEIACNTPLRNRPRIFLSFKLHDLMAAIAEQHGNAG